MAIKPPAHHCIPAETWIDSFVQAAHAPSAAPACDFLFFHGKDLTWLSSDLGLFLAQVDLDREHGRALERAAAQEKLGIVSFMRSMLPKVFGFFVDALVATGTVVRHEHRTTLRGP
jgi:hypothetical protein